MNLENRKFEINNANLIFNLQSLQNLSNRRLLNEKIVFSTGVGINPEPEIPIRFLSYVTPIFLLAEEYRMSIGQIYTADQASIRMWYNAKIIEWNTLLLKDLISWFTQEFYPDIEDRITVSFERKEQDESSVILESRKKLISEMIDIILRVNDPVIMSFAEKRKNGHNIRVSLQYMAEHCLYMRDAVTNYDELFLIWNPLWFESAMIAMVGWPAEEIFYRVRRSIMTEMNVFDKQRNMQLFTNVWRLPPYYRKFMENIIGDHINESSVNVFLSNINPELQYDYLILLLSCTKNPDYSLLSRRKSWFTKFDYEILQEWFDLLKCFLRQF